MQKKVRVIVFRDDEAGQWIGLALEGFHAFQGGSAEEVKASFRRIFPILISENEHDVTADMAPEDFVARFNMAPEESEEVETVAATELDLELEFHFRTKA